MFDPKNYYEGTYDWEGREKMDHTLGTIVRVLLGVATFCGAMVIWFQLERWLAK